MTRAVARWPCFAIFFFGALAVIGEVRLMANQGLAQVFQLRGEFLCFRIIARCVFGRGFFFGGGLAASLRGSLISKSRSFMNASSISVTGLYSILLNASLKSWAT